MEKRTRSLFVPSVAVDSLRDVGGPDSGAAIKQLFEWERDRLFTLAKGLAGAAVAVLSALLAAAFEDKLGAAAGVVYLSAGLVGLLLVWSGFILTGLRRLGEQYAVALRDYGR